MSINNNWIDFFPQLARLPRWMQFWRRHYMRIGQAHHESHLTWWKPVKKAVDRGTAPSSFVRDTLLDPTTNYYGDEDQTMYLALTLVSAGSDNARTIANTLVKAAICYP